ncbi:ferredoxin reductase family protein [Rhizomonospora bruguierae]|uniref:ferredoxin reductase family protein n=1 Tax=Rhizomonospora bruguierae TaxID=1581705 RepID=UPI001BCF69EB|nr:ferredoxin reductase family protein [Micromonospora sp. NBRC 107566]
MSAARRTTRQSRRAATGVVARAARPAEVPAQRGSVPRHAVTAILWIGLVAAVAPWWVQTRPEDLAGSGALLTAGGRITGLVAGYLLLTQVLLMSRLRVLDRWVGEERLVRLHRELGGALVVALIFHVVLTVYGYAALDRVGPVRESVTLLTDYEDMISATVAGGIMVATGLLAIRFIRNAMPYELWKLLHATTYLVLLFGYGHQFALGQQLFRPGPSRTFWIGLYGLVLLCLFWGRVVVPLGLNLRHRFQVADVVAESPGVISIYLTGRRLDLLHVRAGQYCRWRFLTSGCWWQAHPFSLSAAGNGRWLRLTVKIVGSHTEDLQDLRPGTRVWTTPPAGEFTAERRTRPRALLIAGGTGIAPIRALLEELPEGAAVIYRAKAVEDILFRQELDWLADARRADLWYVLGDRDDPGPRSVFTVKGLRQLVPDLAARDVYLCGPDGLIRSCQRILRRAGVPRRQVHTAAFEF